MTLHTPICDLLGIEYPVFAAGMGGVTMAPLTAAISEAGGCGVLGATFCTPDELRAEIRAVREITDKPFGVDLLIPGDIPEDLSAREVPPFPEFLEDLMPKVEGLKGNPPPPLTIELARAQVEVTLEEKVPLMVSALGTPRWLVEECHAVGTKVMSMVGAVRHAARLEQIGCRYYCRPGHGGGRSRRHGHDHGAGAERCRRGECSGLGGGRHYRRTRHRCRYDARRPGGLDRHAVHRH